MSTLASLSAPLLAAPAPASTLAAPLDAISAAGRRAGPVPLPASTLAVPVDATPDETLDALRRTDLAAPAARALAALGAAGRLALSPGPIAPAPGSALAVGMVWRLEGAPVHSLPPAAFAAFSVPGHVKARWDVGVRPSGEGSALLTVRTRFEATDHRSRERLLDTWGVVGPLAGELARRAAAAARAAADRG